jgi:hypothetical protein
MLVLYEPLKVSLNDRIVGSDHMVEQHCNKSLDEDQMLTASFMSEIIPILY